MSKIKKGDLVRRNMKALRGGRHTSMTREAITHADVDLAIVTMVGYCNIAQRDEVWVHWLTDDFDYPGPIRADWLEIVSEAK